MIDQYVFQSNQERIITLSADSFSSALIVRRDTENGHVTIDKFDGSVKLTELYAIYTDWFGREWIKLIVKDRTEDEGKSAILDEKRALWFWKPSGWAVVVSSDSDSNDTIHIISNSRYSTSIE
jgi:hypothetical protein